MLSLAGVLAMAACSGAPAPESGSSAQPVLSQSQGVFARGACASLEPARARPRGIVFLDAGHGGIDPGAFGRTSAGVLVREKDVTLAIVAGTADRLRADGYRVIVSRTSDTLVAALGPGDVGGELLSARGKKLDLLARIACANAARADVLLSIHANAFSDPAEGGTMTFYDPDRPFWRRSKRLAGLVQTRVLAAIRRAGVTIQDRFVIPDTVSMGRTALTREAARYGREPLLGPRDGAYVPTPSAMPGAILETVFVTRPAEADLVTSAGGRAAIADAIASALRAFLAG